SQTKTVREMIARQHIPRRGRSSEALCERFCVADGWAILRSSHHRYLSDCVPERFERAIEDFEKAIKGEVLRALRKKAGMTTEQQQAIELILTRAERALPGFRLRHQREIQALVDLALQTTNGDLSAEQQLDLLWTRLQQRLQVREGIVDLSSFALS